MYLKYIAPLLGTGSGPGAASRLPTVKITGGKVRQSVTIDFHVDLAEMEEAGCSPQTEETNRAQVSVVVPMYNAATTIDATLSSIANQTFSAIEVIVVDDGSIDASSQIVAAWVARDPRFQLVRQENAGVAEARNRGAAVARTEYLAFIDADDVWAPRKIALQLAAMHGGGAHCAMVYCWSAHIDGDSSVMSLGASPTHEGEVFEALCRGNFIANGSSFLVTRAAFNEVGGFDPSLYAANAQGCEDLLFALSVAEHNAFRVVPRNLVGYRLGHQSMSSDTRQMQRSFDIVLARFLRRAPEQADLLRKHHVDYIAWLLECALQARRGGDVLHHARTLGKLDHWRLARKIVGVARNIVLRRSLRALIRPTATDCPTGRYDQHDW